MANYLQIQTLADARGFLYCYPDGRRDRDGFPYWNVTDVNDLWNDHLDDAGYLRAMIEQIGRQFAVDRKRVYLFGHSTGGEMAYTMACQSAELVAGVASLGGNTFLDPSRCQPAQPVNILCIDGTLDEYDCYWGGAWSGPGGVSSNTPPYPGAVRTSQIWAGYNGAYAPVTDSAPTLNLDLAVAGLDTVVTRYANYLPGGAVELWSIIGGKHIPTRQSGNSFSEFSPRVIDWLLAHPKP